jgi:antitoxin (DNA-binding transcriptional repressor) of toxin-antitoxin stability system
MGLRRAGWFGTVESLRERSMATVSIRIAQTRLPQLLARIEAGEAIVLTEEDLPIAKLVPYWPVSPKRQFGAFRDVVSIGPEFFEPLPDDELARWWP